MNSTWGKKKRQNRHSCFFGLVLDQRSCLEVKQAVNCISLLFIYCIQRTFIFKEKWLNTCDSSSHEIAIPWDYVLYMFRGVEQKRQVQWESVCELQFSMLSFVEVGKVRYIMLICALKNMLKAVILKS
jgi:hypothetical protein